MEAIKLIHVCCALLTGLSFFVRGIWMLQASPWFQARITKTIPHLIDTILLLSGLWMAVHWQLNPIQHPWLLAKLLALLLYIGLGMMAFRFAKSREQRFVYWGLALLLLLHLYGFALSKSLLYLQMLV